MPHTALTGALASSHAQAIDLGRLLLERRLHDSQALYEPGASAAARDDSDALGLLFDFGLGDGDGGIWHARLAHAHRTRAQLVEDGLVKAAARVARYSCWNIPPVSTGDAPATRSSKDSRRTSSPSSMGARVWPRR